MDEHMDIFNARTSGQTVSSVIIEWDHIPEAKVYKVEKKNKNSNEWQRVAWTTQSKAKVEHLEDSFCYKFRIIAMKPVENVGYEEMCKSTIIYASTLPTLPSTVHLYRSIVKDEQFLVKRTLESRPSLVNIPSPNGYTPLANAIIFGKYNIADILLSSGASVHIGNTVNRRTPLHLAFYYGHLPVSRILLNKKADINAVDRINMTPCHYAVDAEQLEMLKFALMTGCDTEMKDFCGWTLLQRAIAMKCSLAVVKLLISHSCKLDVQDKNGKSCLDLAKLSGQSDIIAFLENAIATL